MNPNEIAAAVPDWELGDAGIGLRQAMADIAYRLQIEPCCPDGTCYAANFAIRAARAIGARAQPRTASCES